MQILLQKMDKRSICRFNDFYLSSSPSLFYLRGAWPFSTLLHYLSPNGRCYENIFMKITQEVQTLNLCQMNQS